MKKTVVRRVKRAFTLIEVIISFSLIAIISLTLYAVYASVATGTTSLEKSIKERRRTMAHTRLIRHYLDSVLSVQYPPNSGKGVGKPFFMTQGGNGSPGFQVYACLDNGVDPCPALSNEVIAKFHIDHTKRFVLTMTSHPARGEVHEPVEVDVVLWDNVETVFWEFALWGNSVQQQSDVADTPPKGVWMNEWKKEWVSMPPEMIRLKIQTLGGSGKKGEIVTFTTVVPNAVQPIEFRE